ncbi:MAG: polysaccharide deacetylase family protein [Planctomycetota bacterium]
MSLMLTKLPFEAWPGKLVRRLRRRYNDHCVNIVTYHSVGGQRGVLDPGGAARHTLVEFERQLDYLASNYDVISLRSLAERLERQEIPERAAVITFDDGYAEVMRTVAPMLFRRRLPMTVFLVTSVVGNRDLLWQHKLAWLSANEQESRVENALRAAGIVGRSSNETLGNFVRRCYRADVPAILESVLNEVGKSGPALAAELRPYIDPEQIAAADPDFIEFGNHTHTHPVLSALSYEQQTREISTGRDEIVRLTGQSPLAMAYPFGLKRHYTTETKRIVQETWHRAALDLRRRTNQGVVDPFDLSRKPAVCGSQHLFEQMMEDWPVGRESTHMGGAE